MKNPVLLLIVGCALVVCSLGCSGGDEGIKENAANVTKMDTTKPRPASIRGVNVFGQGMANKTKANPSGGTTGSSH